MRVGQMFMVAAVPFLLAACDTSGDPPDLLAPDTEVGHYDASSGGGATVTDADVVAAVDDGGDFIQTRPQSRFFAMDIESRASAAGLDLANLTDYQADNLGDLLGYTSSEWDQILADLTDLMLDLETAVPELGMASYEEAEVPDYEYPARNVLFDGNGRIWVQIAAPQEQGSVWLNLDDRGIPRRRVRLPEHATPQIVLGDTVFALESDELGVQYVVEYRLAQEGG